MTLQMGLGSVYILGPRELCKRVIEGCRQDLLSQSNSFMLPKEGVLTLPPLSSPLFHLLLFQATPFCCLWVFSDPLLS